MTNPHGTQPVRYYGDPVAGAHRVAVVLHGRDQDPEWIHEHLLARLDVPGTAYVAPAAADRSWYPGRFMDPLADNQPHLGWALDRVDSIVAELVTASRSRREIFLIGFSQGGCVVLEHLSRRPERYGGVAGLTSGLFGPPGTTWDGPPIPRVPVLLTTRDRDDFVPLARVEETRHALVARGAEIAWWVYEASGHGIADGEVRLVEDLLAGTRHMVVGTSAA